MQQVLNVTVPIQIPEGFRLISDDQFDKLQSDSLKGRMWTMKELRNWLGGKSADWIKDNILYKPKYNRAIKIMRSERAITGGGSGRPYHFKASVITDFLEKHWSELPW